MALRDSALLREGQGLQGRRLRVLRVDLGGGGYQGSKLEGALKAAAREVDRALLAMSE